MMWKATVGVIVGFALGLMAAVPLYAARDDVRLEFDEALELFIPYIEGESLPNPYLHFRHICCDCRSVHDVVLEVRPDGITQYWWTNEKQTRLRRRQIGLGMDPRRWVTQDPFSAERQGPSEW